MSEKEKLPKCHVCGNDKEPYEIYLKSDILWLMEHEKQHKEAREGGEICERCDRYHAMTGILAAPTDEEFNQALARAQAKEYILCAATWYKELETAVHSPKNVDRGVVLCGYGHSHMVSQLVALTGKRQPEVGKYVQGFLTSKNRFVDRTEGRRIATKADQLHGRNVSTGNELFSEDIWAK
jgi:hypothetical protein